MSKQPPKIRWRQSDTDELQRVINNFNAKLYRIKKSKPELAEYLPERLKKSEVVKSIGTRADFNRIINSYKRFSRRGAEKPIKTNRAAKMTQWAMDEYKLKKRIEKTQLTKERKKLEEQNLLSRGDEVGGTRKQQGEVWKQRLTPTQQNPMNMSQREWEMAQRAIDNKIASFYSEQKMENYKINYLIALENNGYPDDLIDYVANIPNDVFYETTIIDQEGAIDFVYTEEEYGVMIDALWKVWRKAGEKAYIRDSAFIN